jgi:ketosteroid isomerase-like protein
MLTTLIAPADVFQQWHPTNHIAKVDQVNAFGDHVWKVGEWSCTLQTQNGPLPIKGYYASIFFREGDAWKECMSAYNITPPPAAPAETK